jgi:hypothetical protein
LLPSLRCRCSWLCSGLCHPVTSHAMHCYHSLFNANVFAHLHHFQSILQCSKAEECTLSDAYSLT